MRATSTAKNIGHDYWEVFTNHNPSTVAQNINDLQMRAHNKEYLDGYKRTVASMDTRHSTFSKNLYEPATLNDKALRAQRAYYDEPFGEVSVKAAEVKPKYKALRSDAARFELAGQYPDVLLEHNKLTPASPNLTLPTNTQNPNKRFARFRNFAFVNELNLDSNLNPNWVDSAAALPTKTTADNLYFVIKQKRFAAPIKKINTVPFETKKTHLVLNNFSALALSNEFDYTRK